jgi:vacuolar-type H+-ATPase subunit I/STV1
MIILLALFNDLTMLPIAYDFQNASAVPEEPKVLRMLALAGLFGSLQIIFSMMFAYVAHLTGFFKGDMNIHECSLEANAGIWVQLAVSSEVPYIYIYTH